MFTLNNNELVRKANEGDSEAQYELGFKYFYGYGCKQNKKETVYWLRRAAKQDVPFFFKQWGGTNKKKAGRQLQGKVWDEMLEDVCNDKFRSMRNT